MKSKGQRLIVFLKSPRVGFVKTRLGKSLGNEAALKIYCQLVEQLLERLSELESVELRVAPDDALEECRQWFRPGWDLTPQGEGGLGERLSRAVKNAFDAGFRRVMVIGGDCPDVGLSQIDAALAALDHNSVVLGPARDGGYWLLGSSQYWPCLFEGIDWSTEQVLAQTLERVNQLNLSVSLLEELEDIDDIESWQRYQNRRSQ